MLYSFRSLVLGKQNEVFYCLLGPALTSPHVAESIYGILQSTVAQKSIARACHRECMSAYVGEKETI